MDDHAIYFIEEGAVEIFFANSVDQDISLKRLEKGECFGEFSFFTG